MAWLQLRVHSRTPDFAEEILSAHGAAAVSMVDAEDTPILEPGVGETPLWPNTITQGWFVDTTDLAPIIESLRETLADEPDLRIESSLIEDQDWVRIWLENWPPLKFTGSKGRSIWVCPKEKLEEITEPDAIILKLDPGLAFGTGTHPTTALCLEWLTDQDLHGKTVLDYGCGSGILAIAALLLGAERAVGVDIDPQALTASNDNAEVNGVAQRLSVHLPEDFTLEPYDLLLANILANPLMQLAPMLSSCVRVGAPFALAGLLERHAEEVRAAYAPWFALQPDGGKDGWTRINGHCRSPGRINERRLAADLLTMGQPQREHFSALAAEGVTAVINLAMPRVSPGYLDDEATLCAAHGMAYTAIPIPFAAPDEAHWQAFCAAMQSYQGQQVLVHCALNYRVSAMLYRYRTQVQGVAAEAAEADLQAVWQPDAIWSAYIGR
jgi:ribosomal protein L11 methyltransferase